MRRGLTVIELIFVIVIIGILAVVSLPKIAATRDDARMSTLAQNTMTAATEIAAYTVAKGKTLNSLEEMSHAAKVMVENGDANATTRRLEIHWKGIDDCLVLKIANYTSGPVQGEVLTIEANGTNTNAECDRLRSLVDTQRFPIPLHGAMISY